MRKLAASLLHCEMTKNENIIILTADLGYGLWDEISTDYPTRFYNVGSSEQLMIGMAVGLALNGKIPICYSISPFLIYRPAEFIRNYLIHEQIPVKLLGGGRGKDYAHDGFTHWAEDDNLFPTLNTFRPDNEDELKSQMNEFLYNGIPNYMNLKR